MTPAPISHDMSAYDARTYFASVLEVVVGAVVGAGATAAATWWVSTRVEAVRERSALRRAAELVLAELAENRSRIAAYERGDEEIGAVQERLTLGDWSVGKATLAALGSVDKALWDELVDVYRAIHAANREHSGLPTTSRLRKVEDRLRARTGGG